MKHFLSIFSQQSSSNLQQKLKLIRRLFCFHGNSIKSTKIERIYFTTTFLFTFQNFTKKHICEQRKINEIWGVDQNVKQMVLMFTICQSESAPLKREETIYKLWITNHICTTFYGSRCILRVSPFCNSTLLYNVVLLRFCCNMICEK